jgi:hypothetical protein
MLKTNIMTDTRESALRCSVSPHTCCIDFRNRTSRERSPTRAPNLQSFATDFLDKGSTRPVSWGRFSLIAEVHSVSAHS